MLISSNPLTSSQDAYERMRAHFSAPGAELAWLEYDEPTTLEDDDPDLNGECLYRTPDGRACAFGCLVPDDLYDASFEQTGIKEILANYSEVAEFFNNVNLDFLVDAQGSHDERASAGDTTDSFVRDLDSIAAAYRLTVPS